MAFVTENSTVVSFAEYSDVLQQDQRLFEVNEGLSDDVVEPLLVRATDRILTKLRTSSWWRSYFRDRNTSVAINTVADIPALNPNYIKLRQNDFTELCVYVALADYILPGIADFSNQDTAERQKMGYYTNRADALFSELVEAGDWYDFDNSGTVTSAERTPGLINLKRVR
jgi:hypothetical protein